MGTILQGFLKVLERFWEDFLKFFGTILGGQRMIRATKEMSMDPSIHGSMDPWIMAAAVATAMDGGWFHGNRGPRQTWGVPQKSWPQKW